YAILPVILQPDRRRLLSYGWGASALALAGLACFLMWPTATPASDIDWTRYPSVLFLKSVDQAGNACPSLHAAFAIFSALWLGRLLRDMGGRAPAQVLNACWCVGILYSTIATRQHVAIDLAAGTALGAVAFALHRYFMLRTPRRAKRRSAQAPLPLPAPDTRPGE
ncbi:MAG TPA: phosphatase PAP2 family protein, partial [Gammaproteobacteria bacterium]|nr:phosphatase PAP2 family protein [Gammaproteobacteria bacterium]